MVEPGRGERVDFMEKFKTKMASESLLEALGEGKVIWSISSSSLPGPNAAAKVTAALGEGADANIRSAREKYGVGARPLHLAAEGHDVKMIELLLAAGAKTTHKTAEGETPMHRAIRNKNAPEILEALAAAGMEVDALDKKGRSALAAALDRGALPAAQKLVEIGASVTQLARAEKHPLHAAVNRLDEGAIAFMIKNGVDVNERDMQGASPMRVLMEGNAFLYIKNDAQLIAQRVERSLRVFDALLAAGASLDPQSPGGNNAPLLCVGLCGSAPRELLARLGQAGAPMDGGSDSSNCYPGLPRLASEARLDRLQLAFDLGVDVNWTDRSGRSLAYWAMASRHASMRDTLEWILKKGVNPNSRDTVGLEPLLHRAADHETHGAAKKCVETLLEFGANPNARCGKRQVPLLAMLLAPWKMGGEPYARYRVSLEAVETLIKAGARVNEEVNGEPLLNCVITLEQRALLIKHGADPQLAASYMAAHNNPIEIFARHNIDSWLKAGATPQAFISCYPAAWERASPQDRERLADSGILSYLEALELKASVGASQEKTPGEAHKPLRV